MAQLKDQFGCKFRKGRSAGLSGIWTGGAFFLVGSGLLQASVEYQRSINFPKK
jgi:hypothetical protein